MPAHGAERQRISHGAVGPGHGAVAAGAGAFAVGIMAQSAAAVMVRVRHGFPLVSGNGLVHPRRATAVDGAVGAAAAAAATTPATAAAAAAAAAKSDCDKRQLVRIGLGSSRCGDMGVSVWGVYLLAAQ